MNDKERKVVAEMERMEKATSEGLQDIERKLEETTAIAQETGSSLKQNTSRLHRVQDAADSLVSSSNATHKLLNRLRRWGASDHVGRHSSTKKKQGGNTGTAVQVDPGETAKVERLLHDLDATKDVMREEVEDQRKTVKRLEVAADSVAGIAAAKRSSAASSSSSAARIGGRNTGNTRSEEKSNKADDEAALDRIGNLIEGLQDHAKEYTEILEAQSKDLNKIDNAMETANQSMKRASQRLKKSTCR